MLLCVSMQEKIVGQNSGQPVFRALLLCDVHHSPHMHERNYLVWIGGSILYSFFPFQHLRGGGVVRLCRAVRRHDLFPRDWSAHEWTDDFGFIHDEIRVVFQRPNLSQPPPFLLFLSLNAGQLPASCQILFVSPARL